MGADAADLDHRRLGRESRRARGGFQRLGDGGAGASPTEPHVSQIRNTTRSPLPCLCTQATKALRLSMRWTRSLSMQEIERAIDRDRRRPRPRAGAALDDFVGAERLVAFQKGLEHAAADRGQPLPRDRRNGARHGPRRRPSSGRGRDRAPERPALSWYFCFSGAFRPILAFLAVNATYCNAQSIIAMQQTDPISARWPDCQRFGT